MSETVSTQMPEVQSTESAPKALIPLKAILGRKVGMTHIYTPTGEQIPVSVIDASACYLTQVKTLNKDGYSAVQLGVGDVKEKNMPHSLLQHFKKKNIPALKWLREFRVDKTDPFQAGQQLSVEVFSNGDYVDISGTSKGKGFAGVIKRHNFHGLPHSHGASDKVNSRGSSGGGSGQPQRVLKGTRMAGRMGQDWVTTLKIEIVQIDKENQLLLVKGSVPGTCGSLVVVQETSRYLKHKRAIQASAKSPKKQAVKKPAPAPAKGK